MQKSSYSLMEFQDQLMLLKLMDLGEVILH